MDTKKNFKLIADEICKKYKLDINHDSTIRNIYAYLKPFDSKLLLNKHKTVPAANKFLIDNYDTYLKSNNISIFDSLNKTKKYLTKVIKTPGDDAKPIIIKKSNFENNKKEGFEGSIFDMTQAQKIDYIRMTNYESLMRDAYMIVDSRYQNKVNIDQTKMMFNLITNTKTKSANGGVILGSSFKDIVEIEIFPFTIPYKPVYVTFYNKITLSINEWTAYSFEAYEGGQYHFMFDIEKIDNNLIYLKPINSSYHFSTPVNYIDNFSLSFGATFPKISFDADRMQTSNIDYTDEYGLITFNEPHNLITGDLVYISDFTTPDPARDNDIITEVNRAEGHTVVKKDNYTILINVDLTQVRHEDPIGSNIYPIDSFSQNILVYFASKRIQIQFRIRYLTQNP